MSNSLKELPRYKSHKTVWALKIASIGPAEEDGSALLFTAEEGYGPVRVDGAYMSKHRPHAGGYYVEYEDAYKSFSPAPSFERGHSRVASNPAKPPLGIKPRRTYDQDTEFNRALEIISAVGRYNVAGQRIPDEWLDELWARVQSLLLSASPRVTD